MSAAEFRRLQAFENFKSKSNVFDTKVSTTASDVSKDKVALRAKIDVRYRLAMRLESEGTSSMTTKGAEDPSI